MDAAGHFISSEVESDFDYYSRRALEEGRAAARAVSPETKAAHRRMAAAYATLLVGRMPADPGIDALLSQLD